jgi:hypothetical protein
MATVSLLFGILVNIPTLILAGLALTSNVPADYGRSALVAYGSLLVTLYGTLLGQGVRSAPVTLLAVFVAFAAAAVGGRVGLGIAAAALLALLLGGAAVPPAFSPWGPAIGLLAILAALLRTLIV